MPFYNDLRPEADYKDRDFERVFPNMTRAEPVRCIHGLPPPKAGPSGPGRVPRRPAEPNVGKRQVRDWNSGQPQVVQLRLNGKIFLDLNF